MRPTAAGAGPMTRLVLAGLLAACGSSPGDGDDTPPDITVTITSPQPGAELLASEHPTLVVSGTVASTDPAAGTLEAWVNGVRVEVRDGAFTTELAPEVGVNHIKVEGGDGTGDLVGRELDVLWALSYEAPLAGQTGFDIQGALELRLGQRFWDGRTPGTTLELATNPVVAHDVAAALELILWHVDFAGLIPGGGIHVGSGNASLDVLIPSVTPANVLVDARVVAGASKALDLNIDLIGVFLAMDGTFAFGTRTLVIAGGITADLHASARLAMAITPEGKIDVDVVNVTATVGQLVPGFTGANGEELDAFITIGGNDFRTLVVGLLSDQLVPLFTDRLPPFLETLLGATDQLLDDVTFTLDPGLGEPITLTLDGHIGTLGVAAGATGHVTVRQDLALRTTGAPLHAASRGSARLEALEDPVMNTATLHLVMRQDFLNILLHSLWNAGMLEGMWMSGNLTAMVSAKLPPVIRPTPASSPCKVDGERCDVLLQLGQVEVTLPTFEQSFAVNATAGARIKVDGTSISIAIQPAPELHVWDTSEKKGTLTPEAVADLIAKLVWPELFGAISEKLKIDIPLPDLDDLGLGDLAPGLEDAQLQLLTRQRATVAGGRIVLGADLALSTPPPGP